MKAGKIIIVAVALLLIILAGVGIHYLRSPRFQERARAAVIARIEQATGLIVGVDGFELDLLRGRFLLRRLALRSREEAGTRFELTVDEVSGTIRLAALWRPKIDLNELNLVRLHLSIVPQPGGPPWKLEPVIRRSLSVAARKATVRDSWAEYDNRRIPLDLTLTALDCDIQYQPNPQSYAVQLAYRNSPLLWSGRNLVHDKYHLRDRAISADQGGDTQGRVCVSEHQ